MVVVCSPPWVWPLGPSRVGLPFLLSEPNTNYSLAAAPPPPPPRGGGGPPAGGAPPPPWPPTAPPPPPPPPPVGWGAGRLNAGARSSAPVATDGSPGSALVPPQTPWHSSPPSLQCLSLVFFFSPEIQGGLVGTSPVKGVPGRGGDRLSGIPYCCSNNTNRGGKGREKTRPLKLLVV